MADIIDPLIPPYRFERVQPGLYRGSYPKPRNHRFLRRQRLKTMISLVPHDNDTTLSTFCKAEGIERIVITVASPQDNVTITEETVSRCLELATDPRYAPLYLHCLDGSNVTGVVVMCLRKLQLWRVASYQNEYLRYEQDGEIIPEESEFVEAYTGRSLVLSNPYVDWLWPTATAALGASSGGALPFSAGVHPVMPLVTVRPADTLLPADTLGAATLAQVASEPPALDTLDPPSVILATKELQVSQSTGKIRNDDTSHDTPPTATRTTIGPVRLALAANPAAPLASLISSTNPAVSLISSACASDTTNSSALQTDFPAASNTSLALDPMAADDPVVPPVHANTSVVKEIALSRLVQALAIEGLGM
ncbi:protein-tyrosine-phosphatase [Coemansia sp. RSA 1933]|nr:protein-tyrosine-phosphatase [Coemansia sp. RSA 1933]